MPYSKCPTWYSSVFCSRCPTWNSTYTQAKLGTLIWGKEFKARKVGMSSLFINLILKTSHYLHMKVLNERISEWVHLYFYHKQFLRYLHLKFEKEVIFLERFSPYEITESGDKISNF